jgi:hypothetical protein
MPKIVYSKKKAKTIIILNRYENKEKYREKRGVIPGRPLCMIYDTNHM